MTAEQIAKLNLGIDTEDAKMVLTVDAALDWISTNTTIDIEDIENFPSCAKLFILKFSEITNMRAGVTSERIESLSQTFGTGNTSALIWDLANELLSGYLKSHVRFVSAARKWR